jgi:hypothetical protein
MSQTIVLKQVQIGRAQIEKQAVAELYPGHLLERTSADKVQKHSTAGGTCSLPMFAIEDENQGNGIDDAYAADARVVCWIPQRGDQVQAVLADGESVVIGDYLESNGDGTLKKYAADEAESDADPYLTNYDRQVVAQADEALNLSGSSGTETEGALGYDKRLKVTIV